MDTHFKESSEICYFQFNQALYICTYICIGVKTSYYHPGSVPTDVSWHLYFKSATILHRTAIQFINPGDLNISSNESCLLFSSLFIYYVMSLS